LDYYLDDGSGTESKPNFRHWVEHAYKMGEDNKIKEGAHGKIVQYGAKMAPLTLDFARFLWPKLNLNKYPDKVHLHPYNDSCEIFLGPFGSTGTDVIKTWFTPSAAPVNRGGRIMEVVVWAWERVDAINVRYGKTWAYKDRSGTQGGHRYSVVIPKPIFEGPSPVRVILPDEWEKMDPEDLVYFDIQWDSKHHWSKPWINFPHISDFLGRDPDIKNEHNSPSDNLREYGVYKLTLYRTDTHPYIPPNPPPSRSVVDIGTWGWGGNPNSRYSANKMGIPGYVISSLSVTGPNEANPPSAAACLMVGFRPDVRSWSTVHEGHHYALVSVGSGRALDLPEERLLSGAVVTMREFTGVRGQEWHLLAGGGDSVRLQNRVSRKFLAHRGSEPDAVVQHDQDQGEVLDWRIVENEDGSYSLQPAANGQNVTLVMEESKSGMALATVDEKKAEGQKWILVPVADEDRVRKVLTSIPSLRWEEVQRGQDNSFTARVTLTNPNVGFPVQPWTLSFTLPSYVSDLTVTGEDKTTLAATEAHEHGLDVTLTNPHPLDAGTRSTFIVTGRVHVNGEVSPLDITLNGTIIFPEYRNTNPTDVTD
jgi:hypothetical protein